MIIVPNDDFHHETIEMGVAVVVEVDILVVAVRRNSGKEPLARMEAKLDDTITRLFK